MSRGKTSRRSQPLKRKNISKITTTQEEKHLEDHNHSRGKTSRRSQPLTTFLSLLLSGGLALALIFILGTQVYAHVQQANDETAIKGIVLTAFGASVRAVVVPHTPAIFATTKLAAAQSDVAIAQTQAHALFNSIYDAHCIPCQSIAKGTYQSIAGETGGRYRALGWGVRDIEWRQILVNGQTASVTLAATLWSKVQYVDEFGKLHTVTPTEGLVKIYNLYNIGNRWLITNQVQDDVAGSSLPINILNSKPNGQNGPPPSGQLVPPGKGKP
jgi:hypothetical protein